MHTTVPRSASRLLVTTLAAGLLITVLPTAASAATPTSPTSVSATPANASATVTWRAVAGATGYTVTSSPAHGSRAVAGGVTSTTVTGLTNGTSYTFTVVASNPDGFSAPSAPSNAVVPATTPGAPSGVAATAGDGAAVVTWAAPASNGGSPLTGFTVTSSPGSLTATAGPSDGTATVSGLTNGTAYTFVVVASNDRGDGPESAPSDSVTPEAAPASAPVTSPGTSEPAPAPGTSDPAPAPAPVSASPAPASPSPASPAPAASSSPGAPAPSAAPASGDRYSALPTPRRVLDSRTGTGTTAGRKAGPVVLDLSAHLPAGATAAVLNVTVTNPASAGFVVAHAEGVAKPATSNVNFGAAQTQANEVVVAVPASRRVVLHVDASAAHVLADLVGWFSPDQGGRLDVRAPVRVLDTRTTSTPARTGEVVLDLSDRLPAGATSVVLNVTITGSDRRGFVVAHPTGTSRPGTSNVNVERGQTQANEVFTRVGTGANAGRVSLFVDTARTAVIADLVAVVLADSASEGAALTTITPTRMLDTRAAGGRTAGVLTVPLPASVPASARAVVLNVTATGATAPGFVTAYAGPKAPGTSNVNFRAGATQANQVVVPIGSDRSVRLLVGGGGGPRTHLIADLVASLG